MPDLKISNWPDSITVTQIIIPLDEYKEDPEDDKMSIEGFESFTEYGASPYDGHCEVLINNRYTNIVIPVWGSTFGKKDAVYLPIEWLKQLNNEDYKVEILWFNK